MENKLFWTNLISPSAVVILSSIFISSCSGNWKSTHNTTEFVGNDGKKSKIVSVDAEQRFGVIDELGNFCAEPSPDSISALASAFGLNISDPTGGTSGNLASNTAESVASIGLRTQSIQLMRDAMYRVCELKKNGALNNTSAYMLHSGYQDVMIAILSIEQLTGPVKAAQASLSGISDTAVKQTVNKLDKLIEDLEEEKEKIEKEQATAETEKNDALKEKEDAQKHYDSALDDADDSETGEPLKTAKEALDKKQLVLEEKESTLSNILTSLESVDEQIEMAKESRHVYNSISSSTASKATLGAALYTSTVNENTVNKIAESVENIATAAIGRDRITPACIIYLTELSSKLTSAQLDSATLIMEKARKGGNELGVDAPNNSLTKAKDEIDAMREVCKDWINLKHGNLNDD